MMASETKFSLKTRVWGLSLLRDVHFASVQCMGNPWNRTHASFMKHQDVWNCASHTSRLGAWGYYLIVTYHEPIVWIHCKFVIVEVVCVRPCCGAGDLLPLSCCVFQVLVSCRAFVLRVKSSFMSEISRPWLMSLMALHLFYLLLISIIIIVRLKNL